MKTVTHLFEALTLDEAHHHKYLQFHLGDELYATPLLSVKQVIEPQPVKLIPNTVPFFSGLINYRGQIHGLVDLRLRFSLSTENENTCFLIFDTEAGPIAAIVDKVDAVLSIHENQIEKQPPIKSKIPHDYLIGIANHNEQMITVIDLAKCFATEEYVSIQNAKIKLSGS